MLLISAGNSIIIEKREKVQRAGGGGVGCKNIDFSRVAEKYWDTLFRIARSFHGNTPDAEDAVQDAMVKLYLDRSKNGKQFENKCHVRNWLIRVTINLCKTVLRDFREEKPIPIEHLTEIKVWDKPEQSDFFLAVMSLPEQHRTVLYLYYFEGFSTKEIAAMQGQTEAYIRMRMTRARNKLKEVWQHE